MYKCPNCAAGLRFNIEKQMLSCEHCDTCVDPNEFIQGKTAEERKYFTTTVLTCPQCGGNIISEDTTAATFCSYCGASTILESAITEEKAPEYIIPFEKTKQDCENAYEKMMKKAIFAPNELKDKKHIEKFRGIYMPYWVYFCEKDGRVTLKGKKSHRRGDYIITKHYDLTTKISAIYDGISYDGSTTFADSLSGAIAPFDVNKGKEFSPAYISGFYADTSDVRKNLYENDAADEVVEDEITQLRKDRILSRHGFESATGSYALNNILMPNRIDARLAMYPVWFLAYRKKDRVAYAVVNGQTGKVAADLPVDFKKYIIGSLILALPIFIFLNLLFTIKPTTLLAISIFLAVIGFIIANKQMTNLIEREQGIDDKGLMTITKVEKATETNTSQQSWQNSEEYVKQREQAAREVKNNVFSFFSSGVSKIFIIIFGVFFLQFGVAGITIFGVHSGINLIEYIPVMHSVVFALVVFFIIRSMVGKRVSRTKKKKKAIFGNWKRKKKVLIKPIIAIIIAIIILIINPVSDLYYYGGAIICMIMICLGFADIISTHNMLTTRALPQLNKRGGDENA